MRKRRLLAAYVAVLALSHAVAWLRGREQELAPGEQVALVPEFAEGQLSGRDVRVVYRDDGPRDAPVLVLIHGNPGHLRHFWALSRLLAERHRVVVPDCPGFGKSEPVADMSIAAHGLELLALLDALEIESAHLVGFSMGGGVALHMADAAPERVASITMLAAIGVQEMELFGSHHLNRAVHGLWLASCRAAWWLLPHFGAARDGLLSTAYPRNFFDSDQRPLRRLLEEYAAPMLIVHGAEDFLVPPAAAREHHRIVPQSELEMVEDQGHFLMWQWTALLAERIARFVESVEAGRAPTRASASEARVAAAAAPFDPGDVPAFSGIALAVAVLLLAAATFVSEDLTCIGAGLLVSQGRIGFASAALGCFLGIVVGDVGLFLVGKLLGRPALRRAPLRWLVSEASVERARMWFETRGVAVIFLSRFMPGMRLPTYVAAGVVGTRLVVFAFWFVLAGVLWTPILVGLAAWIGAEVESSFQIFGQYAVPGVIGLMAALLLAQRVVVPLFTWRGRRSLAGRLARALHWEFWPPWIFYVPVAGWIAWLSVRHGGFGRVAAVNPAIPTGGFVGESKLAILEGLGLDDPRVARTALLPAEESLDARRERARAFLAETGLAPPLVLKPNAGQRGWGVRILPDAAALDAALAEMRVDSLLQEYLPGAEFGIFWLRRPGAARGEIFSITEKRLPEVVGDGERTLEQLILSDPRAVAMAKTYLDANARRLLSVPRPGERVRLVQLGTHCRGAVFLDGARWRTPALEEAIEELSRNYEGFCFGRYDVRCEDGEALARGELRILELNGLTSEATHIYDPRNSLFSAYRVLFRQWSLAFEIARANLAAGARGSSVRELAREYLAYRDLQRRQGST